MTMSVCVEKATSVVAVRMLWISASLSLVRTEQNAPIWTMITTAPV